MKYILFSMMIKNVDGSTFAIIDKKLAECVKIINEHVKDEYKVDMKLTTTKLRDIIRGKTKKTFFNNIIENVTTKQLNRAELEAQREEQKNIFIEYNNVRYNLNNKDEFLNYGKAKGYL